MSDMEDDDFSVEESKPAAAPLGSNTTKVLRVFIERIEALEKDRKELAEDIKLVKAEAKAAGFLVPVLTFIIRERRKDPDDVAEFHAIAETYRDALEG